MDLFILTFNSTLTLGSTMTLLLYQLISFCSRGRENSVIIGLIPVYNLDVCSYLFPSATHPHRVVWYLPHLYHHYEWEWLRNSYVWQEIIHCFESIHNYIKTAHSIKNLILKKCVSNHTLHITHWIWFYENVLIQISNTEKLIKVTMFETTNQLWLSYKLSG